RPTRRVVTTPLPGGDGASDRWNSVGSMDSRQPPAPDARALELPAGVRYEVLPVGKDVAAQVAEVTPAKLSVTSSAPPGPALRIDVAARYAALGCDVVPHIAARAIRDPSHLNDLLSRMHEAGIVEAFVIGGDQNEPVGAYESAAELLQAIAQH